MLQGARPEECDYCWNVEDNSDRFSDRIFKSGESWSYPFMNEIKNLDWRDDYNPKYVEVAFSNACNFKCSYCAPPFSTQWMEEIERFGPYPTSGNFNNLEWIERSFRLAFGNSSAKIKMRVDLSNLVLRNEVVRLKPDLARRRVCGTLW